MITWGYFQLPARRGYWRRLQPASYLPTHWMNGKLSCDKFNYIWRNFHLGYPDEEEVDTIDEEISPVQDGGFESDEEEKYKVGSVSKDDDDLQEQGIDADNDRDDCTDLDLLFDHETDDEGNDKRDIKLWYAKANFFLDHVNKFSGEVCDHQGINLSLCMIKLFKVW